LGSDPDDPFGPDDFDPEFDPGFDFDRAAAAPIADAPTPPLAWDGGGAWLNGADGAGGYLDDYSDDGAGGYGYEDYGDAGGGDGIGAGAWLQPVEPGVAPVAGAPMVRLQPEPPS
jgi:hypothetical protein